MNCVSGTIQAKTQTSVIHGEHKSSSKPSLVVSPQRGATYDQNVLKEHLTIRCATYDDNILKVYLIFICATYDENILKEHLIIRCAHCLPDCESTYYTSSVSATPLRR